MSTFNVDQYLNQKYGAPAPDKITAIEKAKEDKIASLQAFRNALAENGQQALLDQTIANGRTWSEFGTDVGLSAIQGIDGLAKIPAMVYDKATTGNFYGPETQAISEMSDQREKLKSALSQAKGQQKAIATKAAGEAAKEYFGDGIGGTTAQVAAEFGTAFWEAAKDPASIPEFLAQQAAQLGVMGKVGRASEALAVSAAKAAPALASTAAGKAALGNIGTSGAVASGAVLQGVDTGSDTMQRMMKLPDEVWAQNPEYLDLASKTSPEQAKQEIASRLASESTIKSGVASILSSALPGGNAVEKALIGKSLGGIKAVPKAFMGEAGQEGIEEGSGKFFGNEAVRNIDTKQTLSEGVGAAAGQGAFMGGIMGGGISVAQDGLSGLASVASEAKEKGQPSASEIEAMKAAIATGDTSAYLDPKNPSYSPDKAVRVLYGNSQLPDTTPEAKQANLEKASKIVADLEAQKTKEEAYLEAVSPAKTESMKALAAQARADGDVELATQIEEDIAFNEKDTSAPARQAKIKKIDSQIASAQEVMSVFSQEVQNSTVDVATEVEKVNGSDAKVSQESADKIIILSMSIPERLDPAVAAQMADNTNNSLTDTQRTYLRSFSQARVAENELKDMGKVSKEILFGSEPNASGTKYVGLTNYRARMSAALVSNNQKSAERVLSLIGKFSAGHTAKAQAAEDAYEMFRKDGKNRHIANDAGKWVIRDGLWPSNKERVENGGLNINGNAKDLVASTAAESVAISKAEAELQSAYDVKFAKANNTGNSNVQNLQKTPEGVQVPKEKLQSQTTEKAGTPQGTEAAVAGTATTESTDVATFTVKNVDPGIAQDQLQSTEETTAVSEPVANEGQAETGTLSALQEKSPEGTAFNLRNLVADFFTQVSSRDGDVTARPLVAVKNFLSQTAQDITEFLKDKTLSEKQQQVITTFRAKANEWQSNIQANLTRSKKEFWYKDMMQFLIQETDGQLNLDENVKTAISYSAFSKIVEMASKSSFNTDEEINAILNRDEDTPVTANERSVLGKVGSRQNVVANSLGQTVAQALGLKAKKDAPRNLMANLESSLGYHALKLLLDQGILERVEVSGAAMRELTGNTQTNEKARFQFIRLVRDANGDVSSKAKSIIESSKGSQGVLDKLFSVESGLKEPSLEPIPFTQSKTRNTNQNVPKKLAAIVAAKNAEANYVRQDMLQLVTQLSEDTALAIAGVSDATEENTHASNLASVQAKNDGLVREFRRFMEYVSGMADQTAALYFEHSVWKQQRVGIATNVINPQSSKIHRFMLFRKAWDTKISMGNDAQMDNFRLRVLEGLGVKTDKQSNTKSLASYEAKAGTPEIKAAVEVLRTAVYEGGITAEGQKVLVTAVKQGGSNFHSLDALMALAHEAQARKEGKDSFNVQMMGEIDGVTNGPMLSHLLLGAAETVQQLFGLLNRGGFFEQGNSDTQYNKWRGEQGNLDLYEITASHMTQAVQRMLDKVPEIQATLSAIYTFTGTLVDKDGSVVKAGRNIIKTPLTAMVFGSSVGSAVESMANNFVESVYAKIEDVAKEGGDVRSTIARINNLIGRQLAIPMMPIEELMKLRFSPAQIKALKNVFKETIGKAVKQTMESDFSSFIDRRKEFNDAAQMAFNLYDAAYTGMRDAYIDELVKSGEIATDSKGKPIHDLTSEQDAELRKRLKAIAPLMDTLMSKESGSLGSGLYASKTERKLSTRDMYQGEVKFGSPFADNKAKSVSANGYETTETAPGVAMLVLSVHSSDSSISHKAAEGNEVLNVHDAHGAGLATFKQTAQNLNRATWETLLSYSPAEEVAKMVSRTVLGMAQLLEQGNLSPVVAVNINAALENYAQDNKFEGTPAEALASLLINTKSMAHAANDMRLQALSSMESVDQYALEGGNYTVTDTDRAAAQAARAALVPGLSPAEVKALEQIGTALVAKVDPVAMEAAVVEENNKPSPFGALGQSDISSEPDLVDFFENNQEASAADVIALLGAPGRMNAINRKILALVSRVVSGDLKIRYVTSETPQDSVLDKATTNARGWYVVKNGAEEIYVLSPEFVNSGLTAETLLHELVHAAIARVIDNPTGDAKALVAELDALRVKAQEYAIKNGLTQYGPALSNVQELVAWGMSNLGFQKDVLNKITMESKTGGNRLVTAMQKFISTLTSLLFKKPDQNIDNGLSVLISNVSGLFYEASQQKVKKESDLNLSQENTSKVDSYSTLDIHRALDNGTLEPAFQEHLANLLGGIVEKLHGPFGALAAAMRKTEAKNPLAVWLKAMETGKAPFASQIVASGFAGTSQEDFAMQQVEATVKAALNGTGPTTSMGYIAYKELSALYMEMRAKLKPSDFASQADYDFVFKIEANNGDKSDYLARFAAMGLASHKFNQLLKVATEKNTSKFGSGKTFTERLQNIFEKILTFFSEKATHTFAGQQADSKLEALVEQLVAIEAKKRHAIELGKTETNYLAPIEKGVKKVSEGIRTKVGDIAGSAFVKNNANVFVRAAGGVARTIANDQVDYVLDGLQRLRDQQFKGRPGIVASLMTEMKGLPEQFMVLLRETKRREGERKSIITEHAKLSLKTFANEGKNLTKEAKAAISSIFMRTGAHNLLDHMTLAEIEVLLDNPTELNKAIDKLESQLTTRMKSKYLEQINGLGYFKATGKSRTAVLMLNAHLISRMADTKYERFITPAESKAAEPIIAGLVSLYALKYSDSKALSDAKQVFRDENNRTDGNGVEFVLKLHKSLEAEALQRLFKGNPALMVHGYTPEILNPHTSIKVADDLEGPDLIAQGYTKGALVTNDRADPLGTPKHIYVLRDGGLAPWLSGVFSLSGMQAKGSKKHNGYLNVNNQNGLANASLQAEITNEKLAQMSNSVNPKRDLSQQLGNNLVPVYNEAGKIVNWRYVMAESTKDDLLERNNDFDQVVGVLAGSIYDKETAREQNLKAITALRDIFKEEYATRKDSYIEVGAKSTDPEMRAIWNLLPDNTKMDIREIWGRDGMLVRKDSLDVMFGYRKLSVADFLRNDPDSLKGLQKIFREWFNIYAKTQGMNPDEADNYAKRIGVALSKGERAWQEVVREAKDIIVVKTGLVMLGNIWSNISLLAMSGVPMKNLLDHHLVAMKAATDYQRDSKELAELETLLNSGYNQGNELQLRKEVTRLKDAITNNPVKDLIDAGLMPTIVEDVAADDDIYSYKSLFARKTEKYTKKLNPKILKAGRLIYMTHDTSMYQNLSRITQLSDFVARYTMYQHLISRAENPLSKAEAVKEASDAFVNYDVPMHRGLQYSDDMGFTPFTKYFLRIQRVLLKLARENPARVLGTIALNNYMDLGSIVLDSSFTHHIGNNPLRSGAFQYFGALDDLATIKGSMALIK